MGRSIDSLIHPHDWSVRGTLTENEELQEHVRNCRLGRAEQRQLSALIEAHVQWLLCECANTLRADLNAIDHPASNPDSSDPSSDSGSLAGGSSSNSGGQPLDYPAAPASVWKQM